MNGSSPQVRRNREVWNRMSHWYQEKHGPQLNTRRMAWGVWAIPEAEVGALGDVAGRTLLELGCGGGQWSTFLAEAGGHPIGIDVSEEQLGEARRLMRTQYPLVHGNGEQLPFRGGMFDVVFSDHGAMSWADPYRTVPEVARVLRPGGRLAFNTGTPWFWVCQPGDDSPPGDRLFHDYFGLHRVDEGGGAATYFLGYGDWLRLFRRCGFEVEDHIELRPGEGATSCYDMVTADWARRWPAEAIWVVNRR